MGLFKVGITFEQNIPDLSKEQMDPLVREVAVKIATDAKKNIRNQINFTGDPFRRLAPKTIRNKIAKKSISPDSALIDTGLMLNSIDVFPQGTAKYITGLRPNGSPQRDLLAFIHQEEGVNQQTRVIRRFLGVSKQTENWISARIKRYVAALTKGTKKTKQWRS